MEAILLDVMHLATGLFDAASTLVMACDIGVPDASHEAHGRHFMAALGMA
ncbi:hypothetical protein I5R65_08120 [Herbaspirillum sp. AP02]|nr:MULTISPECIES: hypothetical protein [unclassified Herbaspirillum]MBG7619428.1 hypothetical protein [Herbaspirillum sp. AP02]NZD66712.1 hypothetical protein [Herbaspirillum sp. AP21]